MQQATTRTPFPARRQSSAGMDAARADARGAGLVVRDGAPLFRRTNNTAHPNYQHHRGGSSGGGRDASGAGPGLQAMHQFAAEASAASSSAAARPRTTGSVQQSVTGVRRQSTGSILSTQQRHHLMSPVLVGGGGRNNQHLHHHHLHNQPSRLTRNLTLSDLSSSAPGLGGARRDSEDGLLTRRGWQVGGAHGAAGQDGRAIVVGAPAAAAASVGGRGGINDVDGRPSIAPGTLGAVLSRLPTLESGQQQQQQRSPSIKSCVENVELSEHGMCFGVSALKGHRPYMEDEYKVRVEENTPPPPPWFAKRNHCRT